MKYFYVKLSCPKDNNDQNFGELITSLHAQENHEFHFVNIPNRLTEAEPGDIVIVQLGGDASDKRKYFENPELQNFENGLHGICRITEVIAEDKEFKGIVYP
jgi:5-methylcytosine-specific restriction enzyme B